MSWVGTLTRRFEPRRAGSDTQTADRMRATLLWMFLAARAVHVLQGLVDVSVAGRSFTHPALALAIALACLGESAVLASTLLRAGRIRVDALLVDTAFGVAALLLVGYGLSGSPGRLTSLNWMLPYTVGTAAGLGLSISSAALRREVIAAAGGCALLVAAYPPSVLLFARSADEKSADLIANTLNYPLFFCGGLGIALVMGRRMMLIGQLRDEANRAAADAAHEATLAGLTQAVFAPVLDVMDAIARDPHSIDSHRDHVLALRDRIDDLAIELMNAQAASRG